jgi:hypothetical protein
MSPEDQQALALQQAQGAYDPVLEVYRKQQERASFAHMAQQAGLAKLYDVLGGSMAGFSGQVADIYNTAGQGLSAFDAGYGHGAELAKQSLQAQGAGYSQAFGALPAISGQEGAVKFLTAVQEGQAEDAKLQDLIDSTAAEIPGKAQAFLQDIQSNQGKLQSDYQTLQSKEADRALKAGQQDRAYAWSVAYTFNKKSDHVYVVAEKPDGSVGLWIGAGDESAEAAAVKGYQHTTIGGRPTPSTRTRALSRSSHWQTGCACRGAEDDVTTSRNLHLWSTRTATHPGSRQRASSTAVATAPEAANEHRPVLPQPDHGGGTHIDARRSATGTAPRRVAPGAGRRGRVPAQSDPEGHWEAGSGRVHRWTGGLCIRPVGMGNRAARPSGGSTGPLVAAVALTWAPRLAESVLASGEQRTQADPGWSCVLGAPLPTRRWVGHVTHPSIRSSNPLLREHGSIDSEPAARQIYKKPSSHDLLWGRGPHTSGHWRSREDMDCTSRNVTPCSSTPRHVCHWSSRQLASLGPAGSRGATDGWAGADGFGLRAST